MTDHRVVCTTQTDNCPERGHILTVGTGSPEVATQQWTVQQAWNAIDLGHRFYTYANGHTALVNKYVCPHCGGKTLRTRSDATVANNLDKLPACPWRAA